VKQKVSVSGENHPISEMGKTISSACHVKQVIHPILNTVEEFNHKNGKVKMTQVAEIIKNQDAVPVKKRDVQDTEPQGTLPNITQKEWEEIVNSMTEEEWVLYITRLEVEEEDRQKFDLQTAEWPSLAGKEKTKQPEPVTQDLGEDSVISEGFLENKHEDSLNSIDEFVFIEEDEDDESWALLSGRDDANSVVSWSTASLSYREALLLSDGPIQDKITGKT